MIQSILVFFIVLFISDSASSASCQSIFTPASNQLVLYRGLSIRPENFDSTHHLKNKGHFTPYNAIWFSKNIDTAIAFSSGYAKRFSGHYRYSDLPSRYSIVLKVRIPHEMLLKKNLRDTEKNISISRKKISDLIPYIESFGVRVFGPIIGSEKAIPEVENRVSENEHNIAWFSLEEVQSLWPHIL